jgi:WD40 repeat protein
MLTADSRGEVKVWALDGELLATFSAFAVAPTRIALSLDGKLLAALDVAGQAYVRDLGSGLDLPCPRLPQPASAVAIGRNGRLALACGKEIQIVGTATGEWWTTLRGHGVEVAALTFSADGQRLASVDGRGVVKLWDPVSGRQTEILTLREAPIPPVNALAFSQDGVNLTCLGADREVLVWDAEGFQPL